MEYDVFILVGVLFSIGVYLLLTPRFFEMILGFSILSNAANLIILFTSGNPEAQTVPIIEANNSASAVDPLPQALILTAIVIGFGLTSYLVVLAFRLYTKYGKEALNLYRDHPQ